MMGKKAPAYRPMSPVRHRGTCGCGFVITTKTPRALKAAQVDHDTYMIWKNSGTGQQGTVTGIDYGHGESRSVALCCDIEFATMDELIEHLEVRHGF